MLFNGEQIMTAGEIRRPAIGPISESAKPSAHRAWTVLGESSNGIALSDWHEDYAIAEVAAVLADDQDVSPRTRAAVEGLLHRHRLLAEELSRQRKLLQEWILSQQTYKTLYFQYSGQSPDAPNIELMLEKDMVRRRIRDQLSAGRDQVSVAEESPHSLSRP